MLSGDMCDPIFQVRLVIGDPEAELVEDPVIAHALSIKDNSIRRASIWVLQRIIAYLSSQPTHKVGSAYVNYDDIAKQKQALLNKLTSDPNYIENSTGIIYGHTSIAKVTANKEAVDAFKAQVSVGDYAEDT